MDGFMGTSEINGKVQKVSWTHQNGLQIEGLSLEEAKAVLTQLFTGKLEVCDPVRSLEAGAAAAATGATRAAATPATEVKDNSTKEPAKEPKPETKNAETIPFKAEKTPQETPQEAAPAAIGGRRRRGRGTSTTNGATDTPAAEEPAKKPAEETVAAKPASNGSSTGGLTDDIIESLKSEKKLRNILGILVDNAKIETKQGLIDACESLKDTVPLLSRVAHLAERIERVAESIGIES